MAFQGARECPEGGNPARYPVTGTLSERFLFRSRAALPAIVLAAGASFLGMATNVHAIEIAPHRAIYELGLASARSGATVADVRGRMLFEWSDACDGWTIEQRFHLNFVYPEGDQVEMTTNYATWEAKDGRSYHFNIRKLTNGRLDEELRGDAELVGDDGGIARYVRPDVAELKLPRDTMFPTAHTIALLDVAMSGKKFFARTVFDGSDTEGMTDIGAAVGLRSPGDEPPMDEPVDDAVAGGAYWPVRLAFFPPSGAEAAPEYEMSLDLLENGVARSMLIDYDDFTVSATLQDIEALPRPVC